jgi:hypothetical protein
VLRSRFRAEARRRLRRLFLLTRDLILTQDFLGLQRRQLAADDKFFPRSTLTDEDRLRVFNRWFTDAAYKQLVDSGRWLRPQLELAHDSGVRAISEVTGKAYYGPLPAFTVQVALQEVEGITDALIQRVLRTVAAAMVSKIKPQDMWRGVAAAFSRVGINRFDMFCNYFVVLAHNQARLAQIRAMGVNQVGIIPEHVLHKSRTVQDAPPFKGPGARTRNPSARTVSRIRAASRTLEELEQVNVETAGDNLVCEECEGIAAGGPYDIDEAMTMIPAHPHCRCAFVPAFDQRFAANRTDALAYG